MEETGFVGGDPGSMTSGGSNLAKASTSVGHIAAGVRTGASKSSGSAGEPVLVAAIERFSAALGTFIQGCSTQVGAAATLAKNASADVTAVSGGGLTR